MNYRKFIITLMAIGNTIAIFGQTIDEKVTSLMSRMTLEEKIGQLSQLNGGDIVTGAPTTTHIGQEVMAGRVGSVLNTQGVDKIRALQKLAVTKSRLGIPLIVGLDVIHGYETLFPVPLGLSCTWDMDGIRQSAHVAAVEAGSNGINWTFSPMVDVSLDSRWGRQAESNGEDPYLGSQIAKAMVEGYEGGKDGWSNGNKDNNILSCIKHFALYGAVESGRDYNTVDMSHLRMYNQYFAPYKAAVEAGSSTAMSSFNIIDGMPASGSKWLLTDVLRRQWGFNGFVVTDYATIPEMGIWGVGNDKSNSALALKAGVDMDMVSECFIKNLPELIKEGKVTEADIDKACRRVLTAKYQLGLFDDPYRFCDARKAARVTYCQEHRDMARKLTSESFVLLKNDGNLLPLKSGTKVALIGPMADNRQDIAGTWSFSARPEKYKTVKEALSECKEIEVVGACQGCNVLDDAHQQETVSKGHGLTPVPFVDEQQATAEALALADKADVIVCAMGETAWMSGEGTSRASLEMPAPQRRLMMKLKETGKPIVLLNFAGRATCLSWEAENIPAIMNVWFGSECGDALADVLSGKEAPSGHLTVSMPKSTGQEPLYYNQLNTGRPVPADAPYRVFSSNYIDVQNGALYPFGYGMTYTSFKIGDVRCSKDANGRQQTASCTVTNTGSRDGDVVVQLYVHHREALIALPVKELKAFRRVHLRAGETQTVSFPVTDEMRQYYAPDGNASGTVAVDGNASGTVAVDNGALTLVTDSNALDIMIGQDSEHVERVESKE